jgi:hypothetical protein
MRWIESILVGFCVSALVSFVQPRQLAAGDLTESDFRRLHEELQPDAKEPWRTIPWRVALLDAQQTAASEHKPIFIWAMDGHPLGCT